MEIRYNADLAEKREGERGGQDGYDNGNRGACAWTGAELTH